MRVSATGGEQRILLPRLPPLLVLVRVLVDQKDPHKGPVGHLR